MCYKCVVNDFKFWKDRVREHLTVISLIESDSSLISRIEEAGTLILNAFQDGRQLLICGNGGSAADSQHIATEFVSRFFIERKALNSEALTVNTSSLTAIGNDYNFDKIFSRQVEAKGREGDVLIGISTSGNSKNVVEAMKVAREMAMLTIGFTGNKSDSLLYKVSDCCIGVPSNCTPRIQEAHILIGHMICDFVEYEMFGKKL